MLANASGNQVLQQMTPVVCAALSTLAPLVQSTAGLAERARKLHGRVVEAIEVRDAVAAEAAMVALIAFTKEEILWEIDGAH
ncbi:FCD domain-containing protein [Mycetohabitans sp. B8]|uniref:FCD domain-containing protein n=1 Tax=Mycetohabitans sp. B8 TaxID=2841845 RepID=UPI001F19D660|nr:FCD domain-containing protein [Mycetohabitans sp. B8]MCG1042549.1 FCD domain-containing protein [Mycetohabitans sp. B8]